MKYYNRLTIGIVTAVVLLSLAVTLSISQAQCQQLLTPPAINKPAYTDAAAQLGLPYNVTLENITTPGYVDPIVSQANAWKAEGLNDTQIVSNFEKKGVIYNPKTGDWAFGHNLTPEEQKYVPDISPIISSSPVTSNFFTMNSSVAPMTDPSNIDAGMWTQNYAYDGFDYYMEPGNLPVDTSGQGTTLYYSTTHIGCGSGGCFEIGVYHYYLDPSDYVVYTYSQNDDTGGAKPTGITVSSSVFHEYSIKYTGVHDSNVYQYAAAIDGQVVRTIHMSSLNCQLSQCLEVWDGSSGSYTNFNGCTYNMFEQQTLYYNGGSTSWNHNVPDQSNTPRHDYPSQLYRDDPSGSWFNEMWVQH